MLNIGHCLMGLGACMLIYADHGEVNSDLFACQQLHNTWVCTLMSYNLYFKVVILKL